MFFDSTGEFGREIGLKARMFTIAETPQHVLHPIGRIEQDEEKAFGEAVQFKTHGAFTVAEHQFALLQIRRLVQAAIVQPIVIFRHSKRGK